MQFESWAKMLQFIAVILYHTGLELKTLQFLERFSFFSKSYYTTIIRFGIQNIIFVSTYVIQHGGIHFIYIDD